MTAPMICTILPLDSIVYLPFNGVAAQPRKLAALRAD
jgi:hypothetical protein